MTQLICETAKNMNGPSQSVMDAKARLSAHYARPKQKNACAWVNNPTQQGKEQTMEALREEKRLRFCLWMHTQQEGRNLQFMGAQQLVGERKKTCVRPKNAQSLCVKSQQTIRG